MQPDDRTGRKPRPAQAGDAPLPHGRAGNAPLPLDLASAPDAGELASLRVELASAGARIRGDRLAVGFDRPDPAFTTRLRSRLTDRYRAPVATAVTAAGPRLRVAPVRRWAILAAAAVLIVAVLGSTSGQVMSPAVAARTGETVAATLVRGGLAATLTAGMPLQRGDEVRVGPGGRTTLELGASLARLDGGTVVRLDDLTATRLRLELITGRSYQRVSVPAGGVFTVTTGPLAWAAVGTAFDLSRERAVEGQDRIALLVIDHTVAVTGPDVETKVSEGRAATIGLADGDPSEIHVGPIDPAALDDPWLTDNARQDRSLGFPLGVLEGVGGDPQPSAAATLVTPIATPTDEPSATPGANDEPSPSISPRSTDGTTSTKTQDQKPGPTTRPTPTPPSLPVLGLQAMSCDGGIVVDWTRYRGARFDRYVTVRSTGGSIPAAYPPHGPAAILDGATSADRWRTSAHDSTADAGARTSYRVLALSADGGAIAASPTRSATARAVGELGALTIGPGDGSTTAFGWTPYAGPADCFTAVKIVWSPDDPSPSILEGAGYVFASTDKGASQAIATLEPGTYHFRVEVLRATELGSPSKFVVAHSDVASYTVP